MADVVGLVASIVQIAGAGAKLSSALYNFTTSAVRADQSIKDIAGDVELTSNALESVGKVFSTEAGASVASRKAIQDANSIMKRCEDVFRDISEVIEKERKVRKDGKRGLTMKGKLSWPMKEQRVELHRRRLESLKNSLMLLLHVLQLAQSQTEGQLEVKQIEQEREKIRELHQRQEDSLQSLQAIEERLSKVVLRPEAAINCISLSSSASTLVPTSIWRHEAQSAPTGVHEDITSELDSTSDLSDASMSDEGLIEEAELAKFAKHAQRLLHRIQKLQRKVHRNGGRGIRRKNTLHRHFIQFSEDWLADRVVSPGTVDDIRHHAIQNVFNETDKPSYTTALVDGRTFSRQYTKNLSMSPPPFAASSDSTYPAPETVAYTIPYNENSSCHSITAAMAPEVPSYTDARPASVSCRPSPRTRVSANPHELMGLPLSSIPPVYQPQMLQTTITGSGSEAQGGFKRPPLRQPKPLPSCRRNSISAAHWNALKMQSPLSMEEDNSPVSSNMGAIAGSEGGKFDVPPPVARRPHSLPKSGGQADSLSYLNRLPVSGQRLELHTIMPRGMSGEKSGGPPPPLQNGGEHPRVLPAEPQPTRDVDTIQDLGESVVSLPSQSSSHSHIPLVQPAVTTCDAYFTTPEFTAPGAYFSPLTSPALEAQDQNKNNLQSLPTTSCNLTDHWLVDLDIDMLGGYASSTERPTRYSSNACDISNSGDDEPTLFQAGELEAGDVRHASGAHTRHVDIFNRENSASQHGSDVSRNKTGPSYLRRPRGRKRTQKRRHRSTSENGELKRDRKKRTIERPPTATLLEYEVNSFSTSAQTKDIVDQLLEEWTITVG